MFEPQYYDFDEGIHLALDAARERDIEIEKMIMSLPQEIFHGNFWPLYRGELARRYPGWSGCSVMMTGTDVYKLSRGLKRLVKKLVAQVGE